MVGRSIQSKYNNAVGIVIESHDIPENDTYSHVIKVCFPGVARQEVYVLRHRGNHDDIVVLPYQS